ncbi:MAG TPA: hypothetical protein VKA46_28405 [Gemmataceae bacterium]|nr:hypothetical protein [Gemmataceae bacterium]
MPDETQNSKLKTQNSKRWIWFFLFLAVVPAALISVEVWSNLNQQLTLEKLAAARARWREIGPRDYDLDYEIKREDNPDPAPRTGEKYTVHVKDGQGPRPGEHDFGSMDDLFDRIDQRLRADRESGGPQPFVKATFDPYDGHVIHYVRSVMKTRERLEVTVTLRPLTASAP